MSNKRRKSVSMKEEFYLALKIYTVHLNESRKENSNALLTSTGVNTRILCGDTPPIPKEILELGKAEALENEKKREEESGKPKAEDEIPDGFPTGVTLF